MCIPRYCSCWGCHASVKSEPSFHCFQCGLETSGSPALMQAFSTRLRLQRQTASWTGELSGSQASPAGSYCCTIQPILWKTIYWGSFVNISVFYRILTNTVETYTLIKLWPVSVPFIFFPFPFFHFVFLTYPPQILLIHKSFLMKNSYLKKNYKLVSHYICVLQSQVT